MAVRIPLFMNQPTGITQPQVFQMDSTTITNVHAFATYAYAQDPSVNLEVNTANGTLMGGQPFVDTYYVAGAYSTRVDRFATEAETANIVLTTDNYNRLRLVNDTVVLPSGDTNNFQFPLALWNEDYGYDVTNANADDQKTHLRAMSRTDFIDTFVTPALDKMESDGFYNGTQNREQNGTHFLTTSSNPANATLVSTTPVAVNSEANPSAYTASGIPEAVKQTIDINYYIAKVNFPATAYDLYDSDLGTWDLPLYFDAGTEQIRQHTPASWAALLGPWLRYYMATTGSGFNFTYNLTGTGNQKGTTYVDTRLTNSSTYQQRYVNTDDYRTQEFPNGTQTTVTGSQKALYIERGGLPSYGATANPSGSASEPATITFSLNTQNVLDGSVFSYTITGITAADISSGNLTGTVTVNSGVGSTAITLVAYDGVESETVTCTFSTPSGNRAVAVTINDLEIDGFPTSPFTSWGTETRFLYGASQGDLAQAFSHITVYNEMSTNSRIRIRGVSGTNAAAATPYNAYINVGTDYAGATVEVRYVESGGSDSGAPSFRPSGDSPSAVSGTWYTLSDGSQRTFEYMAQDTCPASGTATGFSSATSVYFEVRFTKAGQTTITRTSGSYGVLNQIEVSTLAPP